MMNELEEIKKRVKISDICRKQGLQLIKRGKNYVALCPFHNEKTASFNIDDDENFYKCFGCQSGGDVIEFYKNYFKLDYATAIKELKVLASIDSNRTIERKNIPSQNYSSSIPDINKIKACLSEDELYLFDERLGMSDNEEERSINEALKAVREMRLEKNKEIFFEFYYYCLTNFGKSDSFRNYLINERRLSELTIEKFELFYIGNYSQVNNHLKKNFSIGDLQRAGLYNDKGNLMFYNHRIIIPYKWKNEITYLRSRYFDEDANFNTDQNKYLGLKNDALNLNTPKRFFNSDVLFGLVDGRHLYITEGEFDCMLFNELGYLAIAIPGVGNIPSDKWLKKLLRFKVILCLDNDEAGKQLEEKLFKIFEGFGKEIYSKTIDAKDPTELVNARIE
jgi:DNA primase